MNTSNGQKVVFLDRDGTIHKFTKEWWRKDRFEFLDKAPLGLKKLQDAVDKKLSWAGVDPEIDFSQTP